MDSKLDLILKYLELIHKQTSVLNTLPNAMIWQNKEIYALKYTILKPIEDEYMEWSL